MAELLVQAAAPGGEVIATLQRNPKAELQVLLEVLEPATHGDPVS